MMSDGGTETKATGRRVGRFIISIDAVRLMTIPLAVRMFSALGIFVIEAKQSATRQVICYVGQGDCFDEVDGMDDIPWYDLIINRQEGDEDGDDAYTYDAVRRAPGEYDEITDSATWN